MRLARQTKKAWYPTRLNNLNAAYLLQYSLLQGVRLRCQGQSFVTMVCASFVVLVMLTSCHSFVNIEFALTRQSSEEEEGSPDCTESDPNLP